MKKLLIPCTAIHLNWLINREVTAGMLPVTRSVNNVTKVAARSFSFSHNTTLLVRFFLFLAADSAVEFWSAPLKKNRRICLVGSCGRRKIFSSFVFDALHCIWESGSERIRMVDFSLPS